MPEKENKKRTKTTTLSRAHYGSIAYKNRLDGYLASRPHFPPSASAVIHRQGRSRAAEKLRSQNSVAGHLSVFIRTNPFNPNEPQYQRTAGVTLASATQDTRVIVGMRRLSK